MCVCVCVCVNECIGQRLIAQQLAAISLSLSLSLSLSHTHTHSLSHSFTHRNLQSKSVQYANADKPNQQGHDEVDNREPIHIRHTDVIVSGSVVRDGSKGQPHLQTGDRHGSRTAG